MTTWYPSDVAPQSALFVQRDVEAIARQHSVHVVHLTQLAAGSADKEPAVWNGLPVTRVQMSPSRPDQIIAATRVIRRMLRDCDVVHTMALSALLPFPLISVKIPWIHTEHWSGIVAPETVPLAMRSTMVVTMRLLRKPDIVVAVSNYLAERIRRIRTGPIRVIPNSVMRPDTLVARPNQQGPTRLVAVGGLVPRKRPELALGAVDELRRRGVDAELTWIGDGPLRSALEQETKKLELEARVRWIGSRDPAFVSDSLSRSNLFVLPTKSETFGVAIAEALAHGRPVVVGAVGAQSEFVHPPCGVLVHERTATAYADAINSTIENSAELTASDIADSLGREFTESGRAKAYSDAYAALMTPSAGGEPA